MNQDPIVDFLGDEDWDSPFFKKLAHNDTGKAVGHQGGIVVPKELRPFFPELHEDQTTTRKPTIDRTLSIEMYAGVRHVAAAQVRYQFQTWGGTRSAESRITDNLGPLRNIAGEGDFLLFQRRADALNRFRLILIQKGSPQFAGIASWLAGRKWGPLSVDQPPVTQAEILTAAQDLNLMAGRPFVLTNSEVPRVETRQLKIARGSVFPQCVRYEYGRTCCVSGIIIGTPRQLFEVEAAHVVPVSEGGMDDIRNGLALTQTLHWAFDRGLFGIKADRTIYLPRQVKVMTENTYLKQFEGRPISEAKSKPLRVHADALNWHIQNRVKQWE